MRITASILISFLLGLLPIASGGVRAELARDEAILCTACTCCAEQAPTQPQPLRNAPPLSGNSFKLEAVAPAACEMVCPVPLVPQVDNRRAASTSFATVPLYRVNCLLLI